ncbi:MAG: alpha/beta hydrolase [Terriglobales bacterium]
MNTRIVFQTARVLCELGMPVLRFNFRGVGRSDGVYDHGQGEQEDALAAMAHLRQLYPRPLLLAGFSFGATVVAKLLARSVLAEVELALLLGLPADRGSIPSRWQWRGPKLMISGDHDEFASVASLEAFFAELPEPKQRAWIPGGDHFIAGQLPQFRETLAALVLRVLRPQAGDSL